MPNKPQIPKKWTKAEEWAWDEIHAGRIADFNQRYKKKKLDPNEPEGWDDPKHDRRLSATFLVTILTDQSFQSATPYQGVCIEGAYFDDAVNLDHARLECQLRLEKCWIKEKLSLIDFSVDNVLSLDGSRFGSAVELKSAVLESPHSSNDSQIENVVNLLGAKIGGQLSMEGSTFNGNLDMNSIEVGQHLFMDDGATFGRVDLSNAKITGQLSMRGSTFSGRLNMDRTEVEQHLFMDGGAAFRQVDLGSAKIGGQLIMDASEFNGALNLESIRIGRDLFARSAKFPLDKAVNLIFATIGSNLDLSGATITTIDLTGTTIAGELRLGSARGYPPPKWVGDSRMVLHKTTVGRIQDADPDLKIDSWPATLKLTGFIFHHLGGLGSAGSADMAKRPSEWFIQWLARDRTFLPHPYKIVADLIREAGYPLKASDILYAGRERARAAAWERRKGKASEWVHWLGMSFRKYTIGYGLGMRYFRIAWWVLFFTLVGFLVLWSNVPEFERDAFTLLWASFDLLLPIIELDESHEKLFNKLQLSKLAESYFYVHKIVGYVLAPFLAAGLAGLTKKS